MFVRMVTEEEVLGRRLMVGEEYYLTDNEFELLYPDSVVILPDVTIPPELIYSVILTSQGGANNLLIDRIEYDKWDLLSTASILAEPAPDGAYTIHIASDKCSDFQNHFPAISGKWATPEGTGRLNVTSGSKSVIGVGTKFLSEVKVGQWVIFVVKWYKVASIESDTALTLETPSDYSFPAVPYYIANAGHQTFGTDTSTTTTQNNEFCFSEVSINLNPDPTSIVTTKITSLAGWAKTADGGYWNPAIALQAYDASSNTEAWLEAGMKINVKLYTNGLTVI